MSQEKQKPPDLPPLRQHVRSGGPAKARVLLIDDEPNVLDSTRRILHHLGFDVTTAVNGREGIEKYRPGLFDLVICDESMPVMEGKETVRRLREMAPQQKIIMHSTNTDELKRDPTLKVDAFIQKPCGIAGVLTAIKEVLPDFTPGEKLRGHWNRI